MKTENQKWPLTYPCPKLFVLISLEISAVLAASFSLSDPTLKVRQTPPHTQNLPPLPTPPVSPTSHTGIPARDPGSFCLAYPAYSPRSGQGGPAPAQASSHPSLLPTLLQALVSPGPSPYSRQSPAQSDDPSYSLPPSILPRLSAGSPPAFRVQGFALAVPSGQNAFPLTSLGCASPRCPSVTASPVTLQPPHFLSDFMGHIAKTHEIFDSSTYTVKTASQGPRLYLLCPLLCPKPRGHSAGHPAGAP